MKRRIRRIITVLLFLVVISGTAFGYEPTKVKANTTIAVSVTHPAMNAIKLSWKKVSGATGYNVYSSKTKNGTYELVSSTTNTSIIFDNLTTDAMNYFKVTAYSVSNGARVEGATSGVIASNSNRIGIDVSKWQGDIDWNKVKADGVEFAIIRVAYGASTSAEGKYKQNIEGATKAGIPVGVYIYSTATTTAEAKKEAEFVAGLLKGYKITYPVCYDIEDSSIQGKLSNSLNTSMVKTFANTIEKAGYDFMLYTGDNFSSNHLNMSELKMYDWWIPHYGSSSSYLAYNGKYHFKCDTDKNRCDYYKTYTRMWQYSEYGKVAGISGRVDMNYELDLKEATTGMTYVDMKTKKERYVAGANETVASIATKLGVTTAELLEMNPQYTTETSRVAEGNSLSIDSLNMETPIINPVQLAAPTVKTEIYTASKIKLTYNKVETAEKYEIYHSTSKNGTYKKLTTTTALTYTHTGASTSATNYYKVAALRTNGDKVETATSAIVSCKTAVAKVTTFKAVSESYNSNKITWSKVSGATGYKLYSSTSKSGTYKLIKTTTGTSFSNTKLTNNKTVYYKIKAYVKGKEKDIDSAFSSVVSAKPVQAPATNVKISSVTSSSVKISWSKSSGATAYRLYRATSKNGKYTRIATITSTSFINKNLTKNKTYYYKVMAVKKVGSKEYTSAYTSPVSAKTTNPVKLSAPTIKTITGYSGRVHMTWSDVKGATGYEIYRSTSKNGTYKKVITKSPTYINNTGLKGNTVYYYKVRAYQKSGGNLVYSNYSAIKSVKTKAV